MNTQGLLDVIAFYLFVLTSVRLRPFAAKLSLSRSYT